MAQAVALVALDVLLKLPPSVCTDEQGRFSETLATESHKERVDLLGVMFRAADDHFRGRVGSGEEARGVLDVGVGWDAAAATVGGAKEWNERQRAKEIPPTPIDTSAGLATAIGLIASGLRAFGLQSFAPAADELRGMITRYDEASRGAGEKGRRGRTGMIAEIFARAKAKRGHRTPTDEDVDDEKEYVKKVLERARKKPSKRR
jgi:hypothetical protein